MEFLLTLSNNDLGRADFHAGLLAEFGTQLAEPYSRNLGDGVRELRFSLTDGRQARMTYWFPGGRTVVLSTAFHKTRQRENRQVERAKLARKVCEAEHVGPWHDTFEPL